ncbi:MAG: indole-3-glycerol phosphate synthase TrpC [Pirellulaceae bacterium]|nr:indole-3-glycerol phosphate synthase TrpC [Pirellulaceae bacterium]
MSTILDQIVATKIQEVARSRGSTSMTEVQRAAAQAEQPRDFLAALQGAPPIRLIAEVKKASPSKGIIRADFDPVGIAQAYQSAGASCLSVLTDRQYFQGSIDYLKAIRQSVALPLLRKDFVIDEFQIYEARAAGADAVLLIAECLTPERLCELYALIRHLEMHALIELYDPAHLPSVLATGTQLLGVNNRDLHTFVVDLHHTLRLQSMIPADRLLVAESGIATRDDVLMLQSAGVAAMLVGESLMRQPDIAVAVRTLLGT